jgi:MFS family permease
MTTLSFFIGLIVATIGGAVVTTIVIDIIAWRFVVKRLGLEKKRSGSLSLPLGIAERALYFLAFIVGAPSWIGFWLAIKVAVQWHRWQAGERAIYNIFLIGNIISILSAILGAFLALGQLPTFGGQ